MGYALPVTLPAGPFKKKSAISGPTSCGTRQDSVTLHEVIGGSRTPVKRHIACLKERAKRRIFRGLGFSSHKDMAHQSRLRPLHDDGYPEITVFVHGLHTGGHFPDIDELTSDINHAEFRGKVYLFHWCSGCRLPSLPYVSAAASYVTRFAKTSSVAGSLIRALWAATDLRTPGAREMPITLIGYSLGARVLAHFLDQVSEGKFNLKRVVLLGGAVASDTQDWEQRAAKVSQEIVNVYAPADRVLNCALDLRVFGEGAAGLTGIQSSRTKVRDVRLRTDEHAEFIDNFDWVLWKALPNRKRSSAYHGTVVVECPNPNCDEDELIAVSNTDEECEECGTEFEYRPFERSSYWSEKPYEVRCEHCGELSILVQGSRKYQCSECRGWTEFEQTGSKIMVVAG